MVRGRYSSPRTSGQSRLGPREFGEDASKRTAFCTIHPYSPFVDCAVGAACTASGGVAHAAQPVSLAQVNWEKSKLSPVQRISFLRVGISHQCRRSLSPWTDLAFLRAGVPLEQGANTAYCCHNRCLQHRLGRYMEPPCVAPGRDVADLSGLQPVVVETIIQARAPSTRQTYALKLSLFVNWRSSRREDPRRFMIGVVLSFLQERLERRLSPSTLKVYVAAIAAHHDAVDGRSLGKHDLIVRFLKGARRLASLPLRQAVTTNRKDLKPSFTEGRNPFRFQWGKEQQLGYLQQQCTQWSRWAPRLANLRWGGRKVATSCMAFVCHALACQHLHATRL